MPALFDHLLFNAAAATVLAPLAFLTRFMGRPALTHAAWLLVLLRLVMPPVWVLAVAISKPADVANVPTIAEPVSVSEVPFSSDDEPVVSAEEVRLPIVASPAEPLAALPPV